jgi:hypothetical protein
MGEYLGEKLVLSLPHYPNNLLTKLWDGRGGCPMSSPSVKMENNTRQGCCRRDLELDGVEVG